MFQNYSDLYTAYLHMFDDIFGTCYIVEKEFFDKLNIYQGILQQIKKNSETIQSYYTDNIDMTISKQLSIQTILISQKQTKSFGR